MSIKTESFLVEVVRFLVSFLYVFVFVYLLVGLKLLSLVLYYILMGMLYGIGSYVQYPAIIDSLSKDISPETKKRIIKDRVPGSIAVGILWILFPILIILTSLGIITSNLENLNKGN